MSRLHLLVIALFFAQAHATAGPWFTEPASEAEPPHQPAPETFETGALLDSALLEISRMTPGECLRANLLNEEFYGATADMSPLERREYFETFRQRIISRGLPAPRHPPIPGGLIHEALRNCARGASR